MSALPKDKNEWQNFLSKTLGKEIKLLNYQPLRREEGYEGGLGTPYVITFETDGVVEEVVVKTSGTSFGREHPEDRFKDSVGSFRTSSVLPRHVEVFGLGSVTKDGKLINLKDASESFVVMKMIKGTPYIDYLTNILKTKKISEDDLRAAEVLSNYLVDIHGNKNESKNASSLYRRHIRCVVGGDEGIPGVVDHLYRDLDDKTVKEKFGFDKKKLMNRISGIEKKSVEIGHAIKNIGGRCSLKHGDFHPWGNVIYQAYPEAFTLIDLSRGEWGEPADDLTSMWINYVDHALLDEGRYDGNFKKIGDKFMENYLKKTGDYQVLETAPPFIAWRGLVIANPSWYPNKSREVRNKIFNMIENVLDAKELNYKDVNSYFD